MNVDVSGQQGWTRGSVIMDYGLIFCPEAMVYTVVQISWWICFLQPVLGVTHYK